MKAVCSILLFLTAAFGRLFAVEVTQSAGTAHAYPAMRDLNGKQVAEGEFTQEIEDNLLRIRIIYDLKGGGQIEEKATFQQRPELVQKSWSWRETKGATLQREYKVDFDAGKAIARKGEKEEMKEWSEQVEIEPGRTFAGFGFTLALQNLRDRLAEGETVELKAVGFSPKPRLVTVKLSYHGLDKMKMAARELCGEHYLIQPQIPAIVKLFVKIPDTDIWLTPPPSGFLRWQGPLVEPGDDLVRVDFSSGCESGPAKSVNDEKSDE